MRKLIKPKYLLFTALIAGLLLSIFANRTQADLAGPTIRTWDFNSGGIWRKEVRTRELARWYRHYDWISIQNLWLKRRAEGVWVYGASLSQFNCRAHCIVRNPNGTGGVWRIWTQYTKTDVRRFRKHYRIWWAGHLNAALRANFPNAGDTNPLNRRFCIALDHLEIVVPKIPADPDPGTPFNEAVQIMDENGQTHLLGEPGFEPQNVPGFDQNPNGFVLATTVQSTHLLPPPPERIQDQGIVPGPGMAEISPGVVVEWLMDEDGNVLLTDPLSGAPLEPLDPRVLGNQKHQALIAEPTGVELNELALQSDNPLQLYCWELTEDGEVLGALPGETIIGPPVDLDGDAQIDPGSAFGGPIAMDPTVRDENDNIDPTAVPIECVIEEDDQPNAVELADLNNRLALAGIPPVAGPFRFCIKSIKVKRFWGIDRRVVMDTWFHHWSWRLRQHFTLTRGFHRVWLTKLALTQFSSDHHHHVFGQPPTWHGFDLTHVRFFRICYRVFCPRPNVIRLKIDQVWVVLPLDPVDPLSPLMLLTTENNENALLDPSLLSGQMPDGSAGPTGLLVEEMGLTDTLALGGGGTGIFEGDLNLLNDGGMADVAVVGNTDNEMELNNNQLQLYCWMLDENGNVAKEFFPNEDVVLTTGPTPAIPVFSDSMSVPNGQTGALVTMLDPTMLGIELTVPLETDCNEDGITDLLDLACLARDWLQTVPVI